MFAQCRNETCIKLITRDIGCLQWEEAFLCISSTDLNDEIRARFCNVVVGAPLLLLLWLHLSCALCSALPSPSGYLLYNYNVCPADLFVDVGKNYSIIDTPQLAFMFEYVGSKEVHQLTTSDQYVCAHSL